MLKQPEKFLKSRKTGKKVKASHYFLKATKSLIYWMRQTKTKISSKIKVNLRVGSTTNNRNHSKANTNSEKITFSKSLPNNQLMFSIQILWNSEEIIKPKHLEAFQKTKAQYFHNLNRQNKNPIHLVNLNKVHYLNNLNSLHYLNSNSNPPSLNSNSNLHSLNSNSNPPSLNSNNLHSLNSKVPSLSLSNRAHSTSNPNSKDGHLRVKIVSWIKVFPADKVMLLGVSNSNLEAVAVCSVRVGKVVQ